VNHRPVYGIGKNNITEAFQALAMKDNDGRSEENQAIYKQTILRCLEREGEGIAVQEMEDIFKMLIGTPHYTKQNVLPEEITADYFAENILGFEEVDEVEEEGEGQQEQM
jgi:hypothetical protein